LKKGLDIPTGVRCKCPSQYSSEGGVEFDVFGNNYIVGKVSIQRLA